VSAMARFLSVEPSKLALLRITVILALLAGFALSPKLWLSSRFYPLTPVWSFFRPFSSPVDAIVFFALIALLIAAGVAQRREVWVAVFALLAVVALQDQSRWQPWFYQYVLMLAAIALAGAKREAAALNTCCLIIAATYIWSGLAKLNPVFVGTTFPWLLEPFRGAAAAGAQWFITHVGWLAPIVEFGAGVGLVTRRFRRLAVFCAIAMHVFVLVAIGPLGRNLNAVVWPWNLAMIAFLLILFFKRTEEPAPRDIVWGQAFAFQKIVLVLFAVMPVLSLFDLWDHYLSSALYSGNINSGVLYLNDAVFDRLPDQIEDYVTEEGPNLNRLSIQDWSYGELNVPAYPETRIFRNVERTICVYAAEDPSVELVVQEKLAFVNGNRRSVYHCPDLTK
jgi:hypothetical protein